MRNIKVLFIVPSVFFIVVFLFGGKNTFAQPNNPMGKTWVIFLENSNYETFATLEGPSLDVNRMHSALSDYKIDRIIHKKT